MSTLKALSLMKIHLPEQNWSWLLVMMNDYFAVLHSYEKVSPMRTAKEKFNKI